MARKRWPSVLAVVLALLLSAIWLGGRLLQPERVTAFVLNAISRASGLQITVTQPADYAFRPEPRLRLTGVQVRAPGTEQSMLDMGSLDISLPWNTLLGGEPVIRSLAIADAQADIARLSAWIASRPENTGAPNWPVLEDGLQISRSRIMGTNWSVQLNNLTLPRFAIDSALDLRIDGSIQRDASNDSPEASEWPFVLHLNALPRQLSTDISLQVNKLQLDATSPLPTLKAHGGAALGAINTLVLDGELANWPEAWPPLPQPIAAASTPLTFQLKASGTGNEDLNISASLSREQTQLNVQLQLAQLQAWLTAEPGSPLPPITGTLQSDRLEIEGNTLEGVRISIELDAPP